jgi:hypothetical protein
MLEKIGKSSDYIIKILSLLFTSFLFIGSSVIYIYFNREGVPREIYSILTSPQILITIAIFSSLLVLITIGMILLSPVFINFCEDGSGFIWRKQKTENQKRIIRFLLLFIPLIFYLFASKIDIQECFTLYFLSMCALMAAIFYKLYGGPIQDEWYNKFGCLFRIYVYLLFSYFSSLFTLIFMTKMVLFLEGRIPYQWLLIVSFSFIYALSATTTSNKQYISYTPLIFIAFVILSTIFLKDNVTTNIITKLGIGNYSSTFTVDPKYIAAIEDDKSYTIRSTTNQNAMIIKDVWVVAALPNKIIIKSEKKSAHYYTIPSSAIISELVTKNINDETLKN